MKITQITIECGWYLFDNATTRGSMSKCNKATKIAEDRVH